MHEHLKITGSAYITNYNSDNASDPLDTAYKKLSINSTQAF